MTAAASRGRRYPVSLVTEVRNMASAEGGRWSAREIARILNDRGIPVTHATVLRWVNPKYDLAQKRNGQRQRARRRAGRLGSASASDETKLERVRALRALRFSWTDVAALVALDFGERVDPERLRRAVLADRWPTFEEAAEA